MSNMPYQLRAPMGESLDEQQLRQVVPSLFAVAPHESRSDKFVQINSWDIISRLHDEGFRVVQASQGKTRDASRREFTKHAWHMRHVDDIEGRNTQRRVGDAFFEVRGENASDGTKTYNFDAAIFRLVCLNGAVVNDGNFASVHVAHRGNRQSILDNVVDATYRVVESAPMAMDAIRNWSQITLSRDEQMAFAEEAHALRFADAEGKVATPITADQLLSPKRPADQGSDLWRTFNRVQENAIKGGLTAWGRDANGRPHRSTTREIKGIDQDAKLNRSLWRLAARMAELKQAA